MKKILIIEDDIYLLGLYKEVFTNSGFETLTAEDGREGLEKAETILPDLILLDLMLPYIDGFEVLKKLKENPETKAIAVIVFTNLDSEIQRDKALKLGADKFVVKSADSPANILDKVKKLIS